MHGAFDKVTVLVELSHASQLGDDVAQPAFSKMPAAVTQMTVSVLEVIGVLDSVV